MSSRSTGSDSNINPDDLGANEWLIEAMLTKYQEDKNSVDQAWWPVLDEYLKGSGATPPDTAAATKTSSTAQAQAAPKASQNNAKAQAGAQAKAAEKPAAKSAKPAASAKADSSPTQSVPVAKTTSKKPTAQPIPAQPTVSQADDAPEEGEETQDKKTLLKGIFRVVAQNMDESLKVPTATSYRTIPAKLMIDNRIVINNHLRRNRGGKVSFTHLIGWAMIQAVKKLPSQNVYYEEIDGKPHVVQPAHINLGIAVDLPHPDGTRTLVVPSIKKTETMNFLEYLEGYEDLISRARNNKLGMDDYAGTTISLTNPGGIGTSYSVPRLMQGQGSIIGAGALDYPAEFSGSNPENLTDLGIGKVLTLSSTYDHRVIQGAGSGEFLRLVHQFLIGENNFYEDIFADLRIPYKPIQWNSDIDRTPSVGIRTKDKQSRVMELINAYRVRGHLMADIDPLEYVQRTHPDLEIESHGLTFWDLDREFDTGGFGGTDRAQLRDILGILRDTYCRTVGIEYMHLQTPEEREWLQERLERPYEKPNHDEQLRILSKLNEAEAFETFLQTKYVGQKRFSLEGGESAISLLDGVIAEAAEEGLDSVAIGMAHRGRLNVLTNIAGKTYAQIFREFEGTSDSRQIQGSGDVKYHLGTEGNFTSINGKKIPVYLAANPSHLEAVNGVLEGIVRAKQDRFPIGTFTSLPILVHGDAAMAGQGVVMETLQMSQLRGYRTGGTLHIVINNQVGFTTLPVDSRTSVYSTDGARAIQAPIFHVNGDDPEAVYRVAQLAFEYRQRFHKDVVIDLICYRRRGHNEGDDPSMTQPLMYNLIEAKRSVRKLYAEALIGRGDITEEEFKQSQDEFHDQLERAFAETHAAQTASIPIIVQDDGAVSDLERPGAQRDDGVVQVTNTGVDQQVIELIGDAHANKPEGFTVHPKLEAVLQKRVDMSRNGKVDWAFAELLAFGSLLLEGTPVRLAGQDSRRGTFVQRHAVFHDRVNGQEWLPLVNLSEDQARFFAYDSLLSEYAALAFEYGYSVERSEALVLWEAQFGDFVNGAQIVIDEFVSSAEQKWNQRSSVTLLLPHGYEGQGPDHSSARIERFLQLAAEDNMIIAQPSTPANHFHLLRRQAYARPRKPLIEFTPKSMLRMRPAVSPLEDFLSGKFEPVLDDATITDKAAVKKVMLHSGKFHYELMNERSKRDLVDSIALVRIEQFYPMPAEELDAVLSQYPNAELVWVQEEPENQGAWFFLAQQFFKHFPNRPIRAITRPASASPSAGSTKRHAIEQTDLVDRVFTQ